jgi:hypothetical protein
MKGDTRRSKRKPSFGSLESFNQFVGRDRKETIRVDADIETTGKAVDPKRRPRLVVLMSVRVQGAPVIAVPFRDWVMAKDDLAFIELDLRKLIYFKPTAFGRFVAVVVANDKFLPSVKTIENPDLIDAMVSEVAKMPDFVTRPDNAVPTRDHNFVHLFDGCEGPSAKFDDPGVAEMGVACEKNGHTITVTFSAARVTAV